MIIRDVVQWFTDGAHWTGDDGIPHRLFQHVVISGEAILIALVITMPIALWLGHVGRGGFLAINVSNIGRAMPSFAVLVLAAQLIGIGSKPAVIALVALAIPPIMTNTYVGMREVDSDARDAARGMGVSGWQMLRRVEVPLAAPLILTGIRTSAVQVVATATLAALVAAGGLGRFIVDGLPQADYAQVVAGAVLVALVSLAVEL